MAERLILHYYPRNSILHRWDARGKLLATLLLSALILQNRPPVMIGVSMLLPLAMVLARIPIKRLIRELRTWLLFFLIVVLVYAALPSVADSQARFVISLNIFGMVQGLWICWRLLLLLVCAIVFSCTTRPRDLRDALQWFLTPLKFLPRNRIAFMAGLTMRFLSLVLDELDEIKDANKARLGELRKNPLLRTKYLVLPLFRRTFLRSDDLALALAARCYREDLPAECLPLPYYHLIPAVLLVALWVLGCLL